MRVKSSGMARGLANARPPGSAKFANAPLPGLTRRANAPQLPGGGGLGAGGIDWCIIQSMTIKRCKPWPLANYLNISCWSLCQSKIKTSLTRGRETMQVGACKIVFIA